MEPDLSRCDRALLDLPDRVVGALLVAGNGIRPDDIMLVGARCRDVLHSALGHKEGLALTNDIDIGLVLTDLGEYDAIVRTLEVSGHTGIRYLLDGVPTDLMPFGGIEDPVGTVTPARRQEQLSVWAFSEVFTGSMPLVLTDGRAIRIPTVEGYAALKLAAWLDRSAYREHKDARDLAVCVHWYAESEATESRLYETPDGGETLVRFDMDVRRSAAYLLGADVAKLIGAVRVSELAARWPGESRDDLLHEFKIDPAVGLWPRDMEERQAILDALEFGWMRG